MNHATQRSTTRWLHIVGAAVLGTYIYSPWGSDPMFAALVKFGLIPLMTLTGLFMWKQGQIVRWFAGRNR